MSPRALPLPLAAVVLAAGCGSPTRRTALVPDVTREPLDAAENAPDARDLRYDVVGGGLFGIVVRSHWTVCKQVPLGGTLGRHVTLSVARSCTSPEPSDWDEDE